MGLEAKRRRTYFFLPHSLSLNSLSRLFRLMCGSKEERRGSKEKVYDKEDFMPSLKSYAILESRPKNLYKIKILILFESNSNKIETELNLKARVPEKLRRCQTNASSTFLALTKRGAII